VGDQLKQNKWGLTPFILFGIIVALDYADLSEFLLTVLDGDCHDHGC
jgi:hypothetical protein